MHWEYKYFYPGPLTSVIPIINLISAISAILLLAAGINRNGDDA